MEYVGFFLVLIAMAIFVYAAIHLVKFLYGLTQFQFRIRSLLTFFVSFFIIIAVKFIIDNNADLLHFEVISPTSKVEIMQS
ncbi:hypothetical protein GCE9029_01365 [Grimontia celer]|uniref:Uncharacterized protein n=1 Tax=Grimontia celer TaxID=1796497 RepID=A0A128EXF5_9GAMM|nr:hypothetical protein GCE9029_01365 [Grimontia celer]